MEKPKLIFKYRAVTSLKELVRVNDIVQNHRMYLPNIPQLNDPFEGKINVSYGIAGSFITRAMDKDYSPTREKKEKTRLLSLSEDCFSPQLWAYYCHDYHGVCLCFRTDNTFSVIEPVSYPERLDEDDVVRNPSNSQVYEIIKESLLRKQAGWKYEREWRMIFQPELNHKGLEIKKAPSFLEYDENELVGIIFGDKLTESEQETICSIVPLSIKKFVVHSGALSGRVKVHEYGYVYPGDGSKPDYIATIDELYDRIFS